MYAVRSEVKNKNFAEFQTEKFSTVIFQRCNMLQHDMFLSRQ